MSWSKKCFKRNRAGSPAVLLCVEWFHKFVPTSWRRGSHERRKWLEVKVPERTHNRHRLRSHLTNFLTEKPAVPFASQSSITNATNSAKNNVALACLIMLMPSALSNSEKSNTKCHTDWRHASLRSQPFCDMPVILDAMKGPSLDVPAVQIKSCFHRCKVSRHGVHQAMLEGSLAARVQDCVVGCRNFSSRKKQITTSNPTRCYIDPTVTSRNTWHVW